MGLCEVIVIHRAIGFRFVIYTSDHEPAHVHVTGPGHAKINLLGRDGSVELAFSVGIKRKDMRRLMNEAIKHRDQFLEDWERIHGEHN